MIKDGRRTTTEKKHTEKNEAHECNEVMNCVSVFALEWRRGTCWTVNIDVNCRATTTGPASVANTILKLLQCPSQDINRRFATALMDCTYFNCSLILFAIRFNQTISWNQNSVFLRAAASIFPLLGRKRIRFSCNLLARFGCSGKAELHSLPPNAFTEESCEKPREEQRYFAALSSGGP